MRRGKKVLWIVLGVAILILCTGSGWGYNAYRESRIRQNNEAAVLQSTFFQQYGSAAVIKEVVSPSNVYAALWSDGDNVTHVSWNIGGLWVTVWSEIGGKH